MRNFVKSFLLAASALLLLASCSNLGSNASVDALENEGKAFLTFGIEGYEDSAARTINPTPYTTTQANALKINLEAVSESLETVTKENISMTDGKYTIELTYDVWYITLSALDGDNVVMQARKRFDLTKGIPSGDDTVFKLSSNGVTTPGSVNLTAKYQDDNKDGENNFATVVSKIECGLYTFEKNELVDGTKIEIAATNITVGSVIQDTTVSPAVDITQEYSFSYAPKDASNKAVEIAPGRYMFRVRFYNSEGKVIGTYGDVIVIAPGRITQPESDIDIKDVLFKKPVAPENLSAYLVKGSEHKVNDDEGYYDVLITWDDKSDNEEHFVLTLTDLDNSSNSIVFGGESDLVNGKDVFFTSSYHVDGNLNAGQESCIIRLPTGTNYDISLKAENFMGSSAVCSRNTNPDSKTGYSEYKTGTINCGMISYKLCGGTLKTSATNTVVGEYVDFYVTSDELLEIKNTADEYPQLVSEHHPFSRWNTTAATGAEAAENPTAADNIVVYASYNGEVALSWTFELDTYGDIETTALIVPSVNANDNAGTSCKNAAVVVTGNNGNGNKFVRITATKFGVDAADDITAADILEMKIELNGESAGISSVSGTNVITFPVSKLRTGNNNVIVLVKMNDGNWYGDAFNITKKN